MLLAETSQIRDASRRMIDGLGFPGYILMETAGRKAAETILSEYASSLAALVLVGSGNNGGDGLVVSRYLRLAGWKVDILLVKGPDAFQGDAQIAWQSLNGSGINIHRWPELPKVQGDHVVLVDALLGTGFEGPMSNPYLAIVDAFQGHPNPVVAIDLPSGMDASSGHCDSQVLKADLTCTFQLPKICHRVYPAAEQCGKVVVLDIGIWPEVLESLKVNRHVTETSVFADWIEPREAQAHKGTMGHVLSLGGSKAYAGAISLTAHAALKVGAGLSTVMCPEICREAIHALGPEVMMVGFDDEELGMRATQLTKEKLKGKSSVAAGPGMGIGTQQKEFLEQFLRAVEVPLLLDADALNLLALHPELWEWVPQGTIITPHPGEMARLQASPDPMKFRLEAAEKLAKHRKVIVVLKGAGTIVSSPEGETYVNPTGNPGMATGGSGDVLAGMIAGLMTQLPPFKAAVAGVYLHGLAGDLFAEEFGPETLIASDLLRYLPKAFQLVLHHSDCP